MESLIEAARRLVPPGFSMPDNGVANALGAHALALCSLLGSLLLVLLTIVFCE